MSNPNNQGYDVFISYAHADNEIPPNATINRGWVTALAENLNIGPNVRKKQIFIDHQLKPWGAFSDDLIAKVNNSKLLVILLSQNYIDSEWCGKELEHFIQAHSNDTEKPSDVFVVELFPYEKLVDVPENILKLRKRLTHVKFWFQPTDTSAPILSGYPTPQESGEKANMHYWLTLNELRTAIDARVRHYQSSPDLTSSTEAQENKDAHAEEKIAQTPSATILLADVTDDLESNRNEVKLALQAEGIQVLPDGDYIGLSPQEFDAAFAEDLKKSECFVQLLSPVVGRKGKGFVAPLPQLQFQCALSANKPIMQWCEKLPAPNQITDPAHAKLFETEFLSTTHLSSFKNEIIYYLLSEKLKRKEVTRNSKNTTFLPSVFPAPWACEWGQDRFGLYMDLNYQGIRQRFRWVTPGIFWMGSPESEPERSDDEMQHKVTLTQGFWLADSACTQAFWTTVMGNKKKNPSYFTDDLNLPVEMVSWHDAQQFITQLNTLFPDLRAQLPTEAQWEYACRASSTTPFSFGGNITLEQVNYNGEYPYVKGNKGPYRQKTIPVRSLPPNPWGLYEMHGNVWEWCADWYGEYRKETTINPIGPDEGIDRVLRGGSWRGSAWNVRSAYRGKYVPDYRGSDIGFRLSLP